MKRILTLIIIATATIVAFAQKPTDLNKAVINVITYDATGKILHNSYGFLLGTEGEAVAAFQTFKGAASADIINWQGQTSHVKRIIGASSEYDLVRFTTDISTKKLVGLEPATNFIPKGQPAQVAFYTTAKKTTPDTATVTAADLYNEDYYYELTTPNEERFFGCPVLDAEGHVVALVQKNVQKDATAACAIDINFATALTVNTMSIFNADLNAINIPKLLPLTSEDDAYSYVYMLIHAQTDPNLVLPVTDDFIEAFPTNAKIYGDRATFFANKADYAAADEEIKKGLALGTGNRAELLNTQSVLMYNKVLAGGTDTYPAWTLDTALLAAEQAADVDRLPIYVLQQGQVLFTLQRYKEAYERFAEVNKSEVANSQTFYFAANALERAEGDEAEIVALLDSAVSHLRKPYDADAAPYLLARAQHLDNAKQPRRAVMDYNEYEDIIGSNNLSAYFYYLRMQAEIGSHMYQQALDDATIAINRAQTSSEKADYLFERGCLQLQVGLTEESINSLEEVIKLDPDYAEAYKICAIAYGEQKQKQKALQYFQKAKDLGAANVDDLMQKYK